MFRRPKKTIRPRVITTTHDDDEDNEMDDEPSGGNNNSNNDMGPKENKESSKKKSSLLSFGEELDAEDGDVFKVKKSSVSRRLMKQRGKERKEAKYENMNKSDAPSGKSKSGNRQTFGDSVADKNNGHSDAKDDSGFLRILNGREAETVDMESSDEEPEKKGVKFRKPSQTGFHDAVRKVLAQGEIPDANLIHEARKRKQMAREMVANIPEFIPLDNVDRYTFERKAQFL